jgi:hypothetical protein
MAAVLITIAKGCAAIKNTVVSGRRESIVLFKEPVKWMEFSIKAGILPGDGARFHLNLR